MRLFAWRCLRWETCTKRKKIKSFTEIKHFIQIFVKEDIQRSWMMCLDGETCYIILHCYLKYCEISSVNHTSCFLIVNGLRYWNVRKATWVPFWFWYSSNHSRYTSTVIAGLQIFTWSLISTGYNCDISIGATSIRSTARVSSNSDIAIQLARQLSMYTHIQISRPRNKLVF